MEQKTSKTSLATRKQALGAYPWDFPVVKYIFVVVGCFDVNWTFPEVHVALMYIHSYHSL